MAGTSDLPKARDDVDSPRGKSGLGNECFCVESRERGLLSGLDNHRASSCDSRGNLPSPHEHGKVPRNDLSADANL